MADVDVSVGGRRYKLSCRDGEETHLHMLVGLVDQKAGEITKAIGEMTEARTLLLSALLIADELNDLRKAAARPTAEQDPDPTYAIAIERLAERVERMAARLEGAAE